jgi:hypothetical protein
VIRPEIIRHAGKQGCTEARHPPRGAYFFLFLLFRLQSIEHGFEQRFSKDRHRHPFHAGNLL